MGSEQKKRIDRAWKECKAWITEFNGTPTVALLINTPADKFLPGLNSIAEHGENLRITVITAAKPTAPRFISLEESPAQFQLLMDGRNAEVSANWVLRQAAFDLDLRLVIIPLADGLISMRVDWWSDQVFSSETDDEAQFGALVMYFFGLAEIFAAQQLFLSLESGLDPGAPDGTWVEV